MQENYKRLFFAMPAQAPWPETFPVGKIIQENNRHLTLAFLGNVDFKKIKEEILEPFPTPHFKVGLAGTFAQCLFFPKKNPRVVSWKAHIPLRQNLLNDFQKTLSSFLSKKKFKVDMKAFTPHISIARAPHELEKWKESFQPLPFLLKDIHLFESLGNSTYQSLWKFPLLDPLEPIDHIADLAYWIRGETYDCLFVHAYLALAFSFPSIIQFFQSPPPLESINEVIGKLNELIFHADKEIGCPFKAVSMHTNHEKKDNIMKWEMIVDV